MVKLIASDMDGTLLSPNLSVSEYNKEAILEAQKQGIEFLVATGRDHTEARPPLEEVGLDCVLITGNGAQAIDKDGEILFTHSIEKAKVKQILSILDSHQLYYELMTTDGVYSSSQPKRLESFTNLIASHVPHITYKMAIAMASAHLTMLKVTFVEDYAEVIEHEKIEILKIITFNEAGQKVLMPIADELRQLDELYITSSYPNNIEINHYQARKGFAVKEVAELKGISMAEVMAIGDNHNDMSMLEVAGVSFAMGNAEPEVKTTAKYLTDTNAENGVGKAIYRVIEENL